MSAEILKKRGFYDPNKLFGLMTPKVELATSFVNQRFLVDLDMEDMHVPVICGHCNLTTLLLFSKTKTQPPEILTKQERRLWLEEVEMYVPFDFQSITFYILEPFEKYEVRGAELLVLSLHRAHDGAEDIVQCCFVQSKITDVPFFVSTTKLGKKGVEAFIETDLKGLTEDETVDKR